ncbi:hypothetical protein J7F01_05330 [Streptomyces sp. ISL-22]|uniref:hypothetical protein n=1 Tax=unclassified Streptomyces TaxID=2593676 RepID=UPI001BEAB1CE|nr:MULTISPECIES: hypothetical protein [unclassified Streptomyces]MBT2418283.1 hypothetical protein [Streptomyces sp. ISL-24]MBT2431631.1 hypothetical protein [Streptomyces sp. ISL-22]
MHRPKLNRHALLSAAVIAALLTTGCSTSSAPTTESAAAKAAETPVAAAVQEQLAVVPAPSGTATPTAVADGGEGGTAKKTSLKVASYDRKSGRAVISSPPAPKPTDEPSAGPSTASPSASSPTSPPATPPASPSAQPPVAVGDIIASAPAPGAPDGVLAEVTEVVGATEDGGTTVETEPAKLNSVLGERKAEGTVPVDPAAVDVEPLVKGVKVSWAKTGGLHFGPEGAKLPLGSLRIDVGAAVATAQGAPASASASVDGFVQLAPEVAFSYDGSGSGTGASPGGAFLGLSGDWASQWSLKGRAAVSTEGQPIRIPFARLHADPVIQVGPIPVVVNLDLTCYIQVTADGRVTVDVEQDLKGDFRVGGTFSWAKGWTPVSESDMKGEPLKAGIRAAGDVKATLGAEATVGLYGTVGVTADLAPYIRAHANAAAEVSSDGTGSVTGAYALYGGVDLTGSLQLQLTIFGTPLFQTKIPLGALHHEWLLAKGEGTATASPPTKPTG